MKRILLLCATVCTLLSSYAQTDTLPKKDLPLGGSNDTLIVGGMVIIRGNDAEAKMLRKKMYKPKNITTNWFVLDLGFSNFIDNTQYGVGTAANAYAPGSNEDWFKTKFGNSINVNIWLAMQKVNLVKHYVNLKYAAGLELNNYRFKSPIVYNKITGANTGSPVVELDEVRNFKKSRLSADYITVPLMLNFNFTPHNEREFGFSAGVSASVLYNSRHVIKTSEDGKQKVKDDFDLNRWKLSYVGELSLGFIKFYGSYAFKSMYNKGLDMTPYTLGVRFSY